ncbi:hypothetical protein [Candidatus Carsonella ruddii]|uniref:hypothetical protein n=1 Tax=Carsonella ruddii TaxID=114186 RepID=UPI003D9A7B14
MNKFYNKFRNLKKILENNYIIISYNLKNIKKTLINIIFKKIKTRIVYIKNKELLLFNLFNYNSVYFFIIENNFLLIKNILLIILNLINIKPLFLISKNCLIKKIPIKEFSKISKENLILEFINFLKFKFLKLITLLKKYEKYIS